MTNPTQPATTETHRLIEEYWDNPLKWATLSTREGLREAFESAALSREREAVRRCYAQCQWGSDKIRIREAYPEHFKED